MINWHHPINHPVCIHPLPIGSMYAIYGNIYHQYTPNVSIYTIYGSYGLLFIHDLSVFKTPFFCVPKKDAARIAILFDQVRELTSPAEASTRRSVPWGQNGTDQRASPVEIWGFWRFPKSFSFWGIPIYDPFIDGFSLTKSLQLLGTPRTSGNAQFFRSQRESTRKNGRCSIDRHVWLQQVTATCAVTAAKIKIFRESS